MGKQGWGERGGGGHQLILAGKLQHWHDGVVQGSRAQQEALAVITRWGG